MQQIDCISNSWLPAEKLLHEVASRIHDWAVPLGAHVDAKLLEMGQVDEANRCARRICVFFLGWAVFMSSMNATACYFVTGMEHENAEIARGLRRRDADLLDRLISSISTGCSGIWFIWREIVNWP